MSGIEDKIVAYKAELVQNPMSRVFVPLSDCYRKLGQYEDAIDAAKRGLQLHPNYFGAKVTLARSYFENGDIEQAKSLLEEITDFAPDNLIATRILAQVYGLLGEKEKAIPCLKRLLAIEPQDERAQRQLETLLQQEDVPEAQNLVVEEPIAPTPSLAPAMPVDTLELSEASDFVEAPTQEQAQTLTLAKMYEEQGHLQEALGMYRSLSLQHPQDLVLHGKVEALQAALDASASEDALSVKKRKLFGDILLRIDERRRDYDRI